MGYVVAVHGQCGAAAIGHNLQAILGQVHAAIHIRPQQAADIGAIGIHPVLVKISTDGRTADVFIFFYYQHIHAGPGEIGCIGQTVMTGANDDWHIFRKGFLDRFFGQVLTYESMRFKGDTDDLAEKLLAAQSEIRFERNDDNCGDDAVFVFKIADEN